MYQYRVVCGKKSHHERISLGNRRVPRARSYIYIYMIYYMREQYEHNIIETLIYGFKTSDSLDTREKLFRHNTL